jgi:hypothetical protein
MGIGISEDDLDQLSQKRCSEADTWSSDGHPLYVCDALRRSPIPDDSEAHGFRFKASYEIGAPSFRKGSPMLCLVPAPDKFIITGETFGRHDEGDIFAGALEELQRG